MFSTFCLGLPRLLFVVSALSLASCMTTAKSPVAVNVKVSIANFAFVPQEITIAPGDAVTWSNDDGSPHAVTFQDNLGGAKILFPGDAFTKTFNQPGSYEYFCSFHTFMTARVIVRVP